MASLDRLRQTPRPLRFAAVAVGLAVATVVIPTLVLEEGALHYTSIPEVRLPLPPRPAGSAPEVGAREAAPAARTVGAAPASVDPALLEDGTYGPLPRIGPDGRQPAVAYARQFDLADPRPRVAIMVVDLGLHAATTRAAIDLPAAVSLQFSPYAPELGIWLERARRTGHEVLLHLPMEPLDFPETDPGPHTLLADADAGANLDRLAWLLARAPGYVGVAGNGRRFTRSDEARPVLEMLARRGLAMVEIGSRDLAAAAARLDLLYAHTPPPIDADPAAPAIDGALAELESLALETGGAIGVAQPYPVSFERLRAWAATLEAKGLVLAPVSALVLERSSRAAEPRGDDTDLALVRNG